MIWSTIIWTCCIEGNGADKWDFSAQALTFPTPHSWITISTEFPAYKIMQEPDQQLMVILHPDYHSKKLPIGYENKKSRAKEDVLRRLDDLCANFTEASGTKMNLTPVTMTRPMTTMPAQKMKIPANMFVSYGGPGIPSL